jgi:hypothetical protein
VRVVVASVEPKRESVAVTRSLAVMVVTLALGLPPNPVAVFDTKLQFME